MTHTHTNTHTHTDVSQGNRTSERLKEPDVCDRMMHNGFISSFCYVASEEMIYILCVCICVCEVKGVTVRIELSLSAAICASVYLCLCAGTKIVILTLMHLGLSHQSSL